MNVTENVKDNVSQVYLDGRFDANTCEIVEQFIRGKMKKGIHHFV